MGSCFSVAPEPSSRKPCPVSPIASSSATDSLRSEESTRRSTAPRPAAPRSFTHRELSAATRRFACNQVVGEGGFGKVYRGTVVSLEGPVLVAVKILDPKSFQGVEELINEVQLLSRLQHPNLVRLTGYCAEAGNAALVYPLYERGSLDKILFSEGPTAADANVLPWGDRMRIALGVAEGIRFLHDHNVIHRDLKPSNVLLTNEGEPILADFGMAREAVVNQTHVSTRILGTEGYLDPMYLETSQLTRASDMYSLGVMLLELMAGARTTEENLTVWARKWTRSMDRQALHVRVDPRLEGAFSEEGARYMAILGKKCTAPKPEHRPDAAKVVEKLRVVVAKCN